MSYPVRNPFNIQPICHPPYSNVSRLLSTLHHLFSLFFVFSCMYVKGLHIHLIFRPYPSCPLLSLLLHFIKHLDLILRKTKTTWESNRVREIEKCGEMNKGKNLLVKIERYVKDEYIKTRVDLCPNASNSNIFWITQTRR